MSKEMLNALDALEAERHFKRDCHRCLGSGIGFSVQTSLRASAKCGS